MSPVRWPNTAARSSFTNILLRENLSCRRTCRNPESFRTMSMWHQAMRTFCVCAMRGSGNYRSPDSPLSVDSKPRPRIPGRPVSKPSIAFLRSQTAATTGSMLRDHLSCESIEEVILYPLSVPPLCWIDRYALQEQTKVKMVTGS